MTVKVEKVDLRQKLRIDAEKLVASLWPEENSAQPSEIMLHELLVHKIELEMQNDELRRANITLEQVRDLYLDLYEFAPVGYVSVRYDGLISAINLTGSTLLGIERKRLRKQRFSKFVTANDQDRWHRLFLHMKTANKGYKQTFTIGLRQANGKEFCAQINCSPSLLLDASPVLHFTITDISNCKQIENELRIAAAAFETQEGILVSDPNYVILRVNRAFTKMTGFSAEEAIGQTPRILRSGRHPPEFYKTMRETVIAEGEWQGEIYNRRKNGEIYPIWLTITAIYDDDGQIIHYVATQSDISQQKAANEQIEQLVFYDPLTNLANRRLLKDRLNLALSASTRNKRYGALLFIDLDHFKTLNDTLGHNTGDLLLKQVALRLKDCVRECDTVARMGGDEFVVMLEDIDKNQQHSAIHAETVGKKILAALNAPYHLGDHEYRCTSSIGITLFYDHKTNQDELFKHADIAMYQAKHNGRNTLCFFDQTMQTALIERTALERDLHLALSGNQLILYYQMQNTHDGQVVGAEVLIRWLHPEFGLVPPNKFIPLAEDTGLILGIGKWVLETACAQLKLWATQDLTKDISIAINVSARQFHEEDFVDNIIRAVEKFDINPSLLKLELTESLVLINIEETISKMNALRDKGIRFAMDDFGTGYSSLTYLTRLPLDQLKIDRSFVNNIGVNAADGVIVQTIIAMTETLSIEVIAEGVETEDQRAFLEQQGCGLCQGYLFSKPVPLADFEALLQGNLKLG
jgi:diguanylate cyclase (GGDEF)-like protein/PAS domain S-box-containing protein